MRVFDKRGTGIEELKIAIAIFENKRCAMNDFGFDDLKKISKDEWKQQIDRDLKGQPYENLSANFEGMEMEPLYFADEVQPLEIPVRQNTSWQIRRDFFIGVKKSDEQIRLALRNDVQAIGLKINTTTALTTLSNTLKNISLDKISIHFITNDFDFAAAEFLKFIEKENFDAQKIQGSFETNLEAEKIFNSKIFERLPHFKFFTLKSENEKSAVDQLKFLMSEADDLFKKFSSRNFRLTDLVKRIQFRVSVDKNYFLEIAKIRALRWLWQNWQKEKGMKEFSPAFIQVYNSKSAKDTDSYRNLYINTTHAMAAIIGGCDVLALSNDEDEFFERLAQNIQLLLKHEAHFDKVSDPAKGSFYIEKLTSKIVEKVLS